MIHSEIYAKQILFYTYNWLYEDVAEIFESKTENEKTLPLANWIVLIGNQIIVCEIT